jgi:hypothetical protein
MAEYPNDASRKSKAEGDRPGEEEVRNDQSMPSRGTSKDEASGRERDTGIDMDDAMIDTNRQSDERSSER